MTTHEGQIEDKQFTCPQCGSHHFGSGVDAYGPVNPFCTYCGGTGLLGESTCSCKLKNATWSGQCHGVVDKKDGTAGQSCRFQWDRKDDAKYFKGTGKFRPRTSTGRVL